MKNEEKWKTLISYRVIWTHQQWQSHWLIPVDPWSKDTGLPGTGYMQEMRQPQRELHKSSKAPPPILRQTQGRVINTSKRRFVCARKPNAKNRDRNLKSHLVSEKAGEKHSNDGKGAAHEGCLSETIPVSQDSCHRWKGKSSTDC
jgi:hypothetical protein